MTVAVMLTLVSGNLTQGNVAGRAEIIDTGEAVVFKNQDELLAFILRSGDATIVAANATTDPERGAQVP